jgi:cellulose synthase/poly-beta-1,6-N-acetylglucosamine synthase-like glycosyltransferase
MDRVVRSPRLDGGGEAIRVGHVLEQIKLTGSSATAGVSVSYVITVYNKRPFLPQVIAGLAAQQGDFVREYVFVDDGSTDGSAAEIARLTHGWPDVRIIVQTNHGSSHATNRGIAEARHRFIKLVDADDVLVPDATSMLLDSLMQHQGAVLAYGRTGLYASEQEAFDSLSKTVPSTSPSRRLETNPLPSQLLRGFSIGPSNSLFSAEAAKEVGGCDARVFTQDYSLVLRLATVGSFVWVGAIVALCPAVAEGRVNDGGPQCLHDANLSIAYFLEERRLSPSLARNAVRRATMRAYHWARRREGAGLFSYWTWLRILAELPRPAPGLVRESCRAFTLSRSVRPGSA